MEHPIQIPDLWANKVFLKGGIRFLVQADYYLPNSPSNLITTLVVITKKKILYECSNLEIKFALLGLSIRDCKTKHFFFFFAGFGYASYNK